jgi:hypothetical protein
MSELLAKFVGELLAKFEGDLMGDLLAQMARVEK